MFELLHDEFAGLVAFRVAALALEREGVAHCASPSLGVAWCLPPKPELTGPLRATGAGTYPLACGAALWPLARAR